MLSKDNAFVRSLLNLVKTTVKTDISGSRFQITFDQLAKL